MAAALWAKHVIKKLFLEDWALKLIALTITLGLWFGVTGLKMAPFFPPKFSCAKCVSTSSTNE